MNWTPEQQRAIHATQGDVLLTAAAGSGKTAVLAARCAYLLADAAEPADVNEILVLTFTEAAAAEMKRRIAVALADKACQRPQDRRLQRQLALIDQARITTVHAFCHATLREFFYHIGLDPAFQVLDADDADLLKTETAQLLYEDRYADCSPSDRGNSFTRFVRSFASGSGDRQLLHLLVRLHNFLESINDHDAWAQQWRQQLASLEGDGCDITAQGSGGPRKIALVDQHRRLLTSQLDALIGQLRYTLETTLSQYPQLDCYAGHVRDDLLPLVEQIRGHVAGADLAGATDELRQTTSLPRLPKRPGDVSEAEALPIRKLIDDAKARFKSIRDRLALGPRSVLRQLAFTAPLGDLLIDLHRDFAARYEQAKQRQAVLDFADLEHLCLKLLVDKNRQPSDVARELQRRYRYVLVDEYQDISPVQEAIIRAVARNQAVSPEDKAGQPRDTASSEKPASAKASPCPAGNLFMVGDVKQTIYGFRQAEPAIFLEKYHRFTPYDPDQPDAPPVAQLRIALNSNFRARRGLIDTVNFLFARCMTPSFFGIDYDRDARLTCAADYPDPDGQPRVECHLIERELDAAPTNADEDAGPGVPTPDELDATRREALIVAQRIRQMVGSDHPDRKPEFLVTDPTTKQMRPVEYRDVVILLRSLRHRAELWSEVLSQVGIPVHAELSSGYFVATEVQDVVSLLQLLDNPQQDIPLAAVLRSPLVGLEASELADIRLHGRRLAFHEAVGEYARTGPVADLAGRLAAFLQQLDAYRTLARRGSLADLVYHIYQQSNLLAYVSALPNGQQRHANLIHLHDRARQFDAFAGHSLRRFLQFIDKLRSEDGDFGPAPVVTAADNVVRIMTVHKSKGLEFPVVIVADLAHQFNRQDTRETVLFDRRQTLPLALRAIDPRSQDRYPTIAHAIVADDLDNRTVTEEMRILYVALTRAREHLLIVGSTALDEARNAWQPWASYRDTHLPDFVLRHVRCPLDWIGPALASHPAFASFLDPDSPSRTTAHHQLVLRLHTASELGDAVAAFAQTGTSPQRPVCLDELIGPVPAGPLPDNLQSVIDRLDYRYPHQPLTQLPVRIGVTDLKKRFGPEQPTVEATSQRPAGLCGSPGKVPSDQSAADLPGVFTARPRCLLSVPEPISAGEIGSWTHLFLERLDLAQPIDLTCVQEQLESLVKQGVFSPRQAACIDVRAVADFFACALGQELLAHHDAVQREWSFTIALPARQLCPEQQLSPNDADQPILLRGIIDCYFAHDEGLTVIDFKTDNVTRKTASARAADYAAQLHYYRYALETITGCPVCATHLYFLKPRLDLPVGVLA